MAEDPRQFDDLEQGYHEPRQSPTEQFDGLDDSTPDQFNEPSDSPIDGDQIDELGGSQPLEPARNPNQRVAEDPQNNRQFISDPQHPKNPTRQSTNPNQPTQTQAQNPATAGYPGQAPAEPPPAPGARSVGRRTPNEQFNQRVAEDTQKNNQFISNPHKEKQTAPSTPKTSGASESPSSTPKPAGGSSSGPSAAAKADIIAAGAAQLADKLGGDETAAGRAAKAVGGLASDVKDVIKIATAEAGNVVGAVQGIAGLVRRHWNIILFLLIPFLILITAPIFFFIGLNSGDPGDTPAGIGVNPQTNPDDPISNPGGIYCSEMSTTLNVKTGRTSTRLILPAIQGGFSEEESINRSGQMPSTGGRITFSHLLGRPGFNPAWDDYYITARWPYVAWNWNGTSTSRGFPGLPSSSVYGGKRVMLYNPKNSKAVMGIILEAGPAPWTGVAQSATSNNPIRRTRQLHPGYSPEEQRNAWGRNPRIDAPAGYVGRISGGPNSKIGSTLEVGPDDIIIMGFANENLQNSAPGPTTCTPLTRQGTGSIKLNVPGVVEATSGDCAQASVLMTILYYNPEFYTHPANRNSSGRPIFLNRDSRGRWATNDNQGCVSNYSSFLNGSATLGRTSGWTSWDSTGTSKEKVIGAIKKSLQGGDPLIVFLKQGAIYSNSKHVVSIVGYNDADRTFYINNPYPSRAGGGVEIGTNTPGGKLMTYDRLVDYLGEHGRGGPYNQGFIIRRNYLP